MTDEQLSPAVKLAIKDAVNDAIKEVVKHAVKEAVREETMFFTQTAINHGIQIEELRGRAGVNSLRVKAHGKMLERLTSNRAMLVYHLIQLLAIGATALTR